MNELARLVPLIFEGQPCLITDRNGDAWFAARDVCKILEIKNPSDAVKNFPSDEKAYVICDIDSNYITSAVFSKHGTSAECDITSSYITSAGYSISGTSAKSRARKTQRILILNEEGVFRLIRKSRKPVAQRFMDRIGKLLPEIRRHGLNRAVLPRIWSKKELTWGEWVNKREESREKWLNGDIFRVVKDE